MQYSKIANNIVNDCVKIRQINPERTEGNDKKDSFEKMKLTSCNSWFRKTMIQKMQVPFLPRMKKLNEKTQKENNEQVKTFFHITKNPVKQNLSLYDFKKRYKPKHKNFF